MVNLLEKTTRGDEVFVTYHPFDTMEQMLDTLETNLGIFGYCRYGLLTEGYCSFRLGGVHTILILDNEDLGWEPLVEFPLTKIQTVE